MAGQRRIDIRPRYLVITGLVVLLAVMALATTYVDADDERVDTAETFDPDAFATEQFPQVSAAIEESAVELPELLAALEADRDAANERYGNRGDVTSPYTFPVRGTGAAGAAEAGMLPVEIEGVLDDVGVQIQVGPVLRGTVLRDAVDFITFDQFRNQLEYADAARALNSQVLTQVLAGFDPDAAEGAQVSFIGAVTIISPTVVTVTPVRLEVAP